MLPDTRFVKQPTQFWAAVRAISEHIGYVHEQLTVSQLANELRHVEVALKPKPVKGLPPECKTSEHKKSYRIAYAGPMTISSRDALIRLDPKQRKGWVSAINSLYKRSLAWSWINPALLITANDTPTEAGQRLCDYLNFRQTRFEEIKPLLMKKADAKSMFERIRKRDGSIVPIPKNKQKGDKAGEAYFTGTVNALIDANRGNYACDYDPQSLCTFLRNGEPLMTMTRRLDGAFPSTVNPIAVWEIKEYYNTTTFGSRVAGGVYETTLDGMELKQLLEAQGVKCRHYVFIDDYKTWWEMGRSYLCRFIDLLHMGYVDEVIVGREIEDRVPKLAQEWVRLVRDREPKKK